MGASRLYRSLIILAFLMMAACTGGGIEGGQSGTGIGASIVGNVATVGGATDVSDIQVTINGTDVTAVTDVAGGFTLSGDLSGPEVLVFRRERDDLLAEVEVVVPAGGRLELGDIEIDLEDGQATPTRRFIEFEGIIDGVDCATGELRIATRLEGERAFFSVSLSDAFVHDSMGTEVACEALSPGFEVEAKAGVDTSGQLSNADIQIQSELDDHNDGQEDQEDSQDQPANDQMQEDKEEPEDDGNVSEDDGREDPQSDDELSEEMRQ